jgi:hypothetical protein
MHTSVRAAWLDFNRPFEGRLHVMYLDTHRDDKGNLAPLVTTGVGNLIDPVGEALRLPWFHWGNPAAPATPDEIRAEWEMIKSHTELAPLGGRAFEAIATLELSDDAIDALCMQKLAGNEALLKAHVAEFATFDTWPADAQMALLSMAWGMGAGFVFGRDSHGQLKVLLWPSFRAACDALDFDKAADECRMSEVGNPGVRPRNDANQRLFHNAAVVRRNPDNYDPSTLYYPAYCLDAIVITP